MSFSTTLLSLISVASVVAAWYWQRQASHQTEAVLIPVRTDETRYRP